jgi:tRNA-dihydrouridine synthase A
MKASAKLPVTVKCRIGVDDQDPEPALDALADGVLAAGADALWVHARKAWLEGLSPKENREIPPLDYARVYRLKARKPNEFIGINGGIQSLAEVSAHLGHVDGVMLGRAAYHTPGILTGVDATFYGEAAIAFDYPALIDAMAGYAARHIERGGRLGHITRHMVGLFHGLPGARRFRQILSVVAKLPGAGREVRGTAFAAIDFTAAEAEAA